VRESLLQYTVLFSWRGCCRLEKMNDESQVGHLHVNEKRLITVMQQGTITNKFEKFLQKIIICKASF
jgi:hypothetical protein